MLLGVLPIFHAFGYTITLWTVLTLPPKGVYHYSPLEPREVGKLCREHGATIMIATPTFLRSYLRRCEPEDFAELDVVFTGAEKLPPELAEAFEQRFGVRPVEGYGATELSPVVSANIPPSRASEPSNEGCAKGRSAGPCPASRSKVVDLETGEDLGAEPPGMLLVSGPNVMQGYFGRPELTAEVIARRLVHDRRRGRDRRRRIHHDHRPRKPVLENRRRDGAAHPHGRGDSQVLALRRRRVEGRRHGRARPEEGRAAGGAHTELRQTPEQICRALGRRAACRRCGFPRPTAFAASRPFPCSAPASWI